MSGVSGQSILDIAYEYDRVGNILAILDARDDDESPTGTGDFEYDSAYNLINAQLDPLNERWSETLNYEYDVIGRILRKVSDRGVDSPAHVGTYQYGQSVQSPYLLTSVDDGFGVVTEFAYNEAGHMIQHGAHTIERDSTGRITSVYLSGQEVNRSVYGQGRDRLVKIEDDQVSWYPSRDFEVRGGNHIISLIVGNQRVVREEYANRSGKWLTDLAPITIEGARTTLNGDDKITAADAWIAYAKERDLISGLDSVDADQSATLLSASASRFALEEDKRQQTLHYDHLGSLKAVDEGATDEPMERLQTASTVAQPTGDQG